MAFEVAVKCWLVPVVVNISLLVNQLAPGRGVAVFTGLAVGVHVGVGEVVNVGLIVGEKVIVAEWVGLCVNPGVRVFVCDGVNVTVPVTAAFAVRLNVTKIEKNKSLTLFILLHLD